ncbi:MAG TPA: glycosyltransferase, partial [Saprospiraceae bacterium]|nr:glycosyltransferase [Saprospiraceae bacterium]
MNSCLVIIPTYNEVENIQAIIDAVLVQGSHFSVLVVDDGSPDGTANTVKSLQTNEKRIHLIERAEKMGLGTAYITGFKYGLDHNFDYIFEMD